MRKKNIASIILVVVLLFACTSRINHHAELVRIDSLMTSHSDSAWAILKRFQFYRLKTKADKAYYTLLLTQARDKNYDVQINDSLIHSVVTYYDQTDDVSKQALAHYYFGCVNRDSKQCKEALVQYFIAIPLAVQAKEEHLLGQIYSNIGHLYHIHNLNVQADSIFQLAELVAIRLHELPFQGEILWHRGDILMEKGKSFYSKAEMLFQQALAIANNLSCDQLKRSLYSSLTLLYNRMENKKKALRCALLNLQQQDDTLHCYKAYQLLGSTYCELSEYDSAFYYLNKALPANDYAIKSNVYSRLAEIARNQGDFKLAVEMERCHSAYKDSLRLKNQAVELIRAEKEVQLYQQKKEHDKRLGHLKIYLWLFLGTSTLIIMLLHKRFYKKTTQLQWEKELVLEKQKQINLQQKQIQKKLLQKETELIELQKVLEHKEEDEKQKLFLKAELEELHLERTALLQDNYLRADVIAKMKSIISAYKKFDKSNEVMLEEDWQQLIIETDQRWNNITLKLHTKYDLSQDEIYLCCLYLTDFPINSFGYLLGCTRDCIYKKANRIVEQKMGYPHKAVVLQEILRELK